MDQPRRHDGRATSIRKRNTTYTGTIDRITVRVQQIVMMGTSGSLVTEPINAHKPHDAPPADRGADAQSQAKLAKLASALRHASDLAAGSAI